MKIFLEICGFIMWVGGLASLKEISNKAWLLGNIAGIGVTIFINAMYI